MVHDAFKGWYWRTRNLWELQSNRLHQQHRQQPTFHSFETHWHMFPDKNRLKVWVWVKKVGNTVNKSYYTWTLVTNLVRSAATILAMCTNGPSFPSGIPEPNVAVRPTTFATSVLKVKYSLSTTPLNIINRICMYIREYQDMDFFPDQLQTFIERCIGHPKISIPFRQV